MRYLLALFLPWLACFSIGMIGSGIICLILQLTMIGWMPAAIWAFFAINNFYADRRNDELLRAIGKTAPPSREAAGSLAVDARGAAFVSRRSLAQRGRGRLFRSRVVGVRRPGERRPVVGETGARIDALGLVDQGDAVLDRADQRRRGCSRRIRRR